MKIESERDAAIKAIGTEATLRGKAEAERDAALAMVRELVELCQPLAHFVYIYEHMRGLNQETVYGCTNAHGSAEIDVANLKAIRKAITKAEAKDV
jgi:spore maturation protein SpmB